MGHIVRRAESGSKGVAPRESADRDLKLVARLNAVRHQHLQLSAVPEQTGKFNAMLRMAWVPS